MSTKTEHMSFIKIDIMAKTVLLDRNRLYRCTYNSVYTCVYIAYISHIVGSYMLCLEMLWKWHYIMWFCHMQTLSNIFLHAHFSQVKSHMIRCVKYVSYMIHLHVLFLYIRTLTLSFGKYAFSNQRSTLPLSYCYSYNQETTSLA